MSMIDQARAARHPVNVGHLVMGTAFVGLVGVWALVAAGFFSDGNIRYLLPIPWVLAGLAGLLATLLPGRRGAAAAPAEPVDEG